MIGVSGVPGGFQATSMDAGFVHLTERLVGGSGGSMDKYV